MNNTDYQAIFAKANEGGSLLARADATPKRTAAQRSKTPPSGGALTAAQALEQATACQQPSESARHECARESASEREEKKEAREEELGRRPVRETAREARENSQWQSLGKVPQNWAHPPQKKRDDHNKRAALEGTT